MSQNILIVDDEKEFTKLMSQMLSFRNYNPIEANSGQGAIDILAKTHVDLMTLDLNMPGMDGLQVAKIVNEKYPALKIVVITGFGSDYDDQIKNYKIDRVLPKPLPFAELMSALKELLGS